MRQVVSAVRLSLPVLQKVIFLSRVFFVYFLLHHNCLCPGVEPQNTKRHNHILIFISTILLSQFLLQTQTHSNTQQMQKTNGLAEYENKLQFTIRQICKRTDQSSVATQQFYDAYYC